MADDTEGSSDPQVTFKVKTSGDGLHTITMAESASVLELKTKLATAEFENIPVERQRLIYSGRVMKNDDTLGSYKIKNGNTLHLVKSAASNHPPTTAAAAASSAAGAAPASAVPTNMAAGTSAGNLLAGLTGARFAGHAPLPNMDIFGPDGGMNLPSEDQLSEMMTNPAVLQSMNEALNNDAFVDMLLQQNPALRNTPNARELIQSPMFRHMLTDPNSIRMMGQMRRAMGGGLNAFPAPGATDSTPVGAAASPAAGGANPAAGQAANPFAAMANPFLFGPPGATASTRMNGNGNPGGDIGQLMSMLFPSGRTPGAGAAPAAATPTTGGETDATRAAGQPAGAAAAPGAGAGTDAAANPFAGLFGAPPPGFQMTPEMMQQALQMLGGGGAGGLFGQGSPPPPPDNRPPEERYADQLRQLNDMGFYDFDQNVAALRRSGGSVQGAIQHLLGD